MSKSLYEQYAEIQQPKVLETQVPLSHAIEKIKAYKKHLSKEYIEWAEEVVSIIYDRTFEEIKDAVDGKETWVSIAGMFDRRR